MKPLQNFVLGLQFLTRINVTKKNMPCEKEDFRGAMYFFVAIGMIVGILQYAVFQIFNSLGHEAFAIFMATLAGIYLTGGIHLDGVADIFDGFGANANRERTLEIMKDSHIGAFGVVALMIDILYHLVAFYALKDYPIAFIMVPMSGKLGICLLCKLGKNIKQGLGALWIENIKGLGVSINLLLAVIVFTLLLGNVLVAVGMLGVIGLGVYGLNKKFTQKLGGLNGDCLGATNQMIEWLVLTYLVILLT